MGIAVRVVVIPAAGRILCRRLTSRIVRTMPLVARHCGDIRILCRDCHERVGGVFPMANELSPRTTRIGAREDQS